MSKLSWYIARLQQMRPAEIAWRTGAILRVPFDYARMRSDRRQQPAHQGEWWKQDRYPITAHNDGGTFDRIRIFDLTFQADFAFDWHRDHLHGKSSPRKFARSLDIRNSEVVGDIKYIWEPNRHQHLSAIAYSNRTDANSIVASALKDWLANNPFLIGVNWTSSLELATRLISWALMFPALRKTFDADRHFREAFAQSVYQHLATIRRNLSLYSSANNHLLGELTGLYIGSVCFPWWPECRAWRKFALASLEREAGLQFTPEGINREQAMSYQIFTLELLLAAILIAKNSGDTVGPNLRQRTQSALNYLDKVATPAGDLPWYGDSDDARGFVLSEHETGLEVVMQLGAMLFDVSRLARRSSRITAAALALIPDAEARLTNLTNQRIQQSEDSALFRDGGLAVLNGSECKLLMDIGPLGYTNIAAHGHADALSILIAAGDQYVLIDSGTYAYHSNPEWRSYFRGTAAHNTVRIDGVDQSVMTGRFLWSSKAKVRLIEFKEADTEISIAAEHDGYARLADPVVHRRSVTLDRARQVITVEDMLVCKAEHEVELHWHLSERAELTRSGQVVRAEVGARVVSLAFEGQGFQLDVTKGRSEPILGWRSPAFNQKVAIPTLRFSGRITGTTTITTVINVAEVSSEQPESMLSQATHA